MEYRVTLRFAMPKRDEKGQKTNIEPGSFIEHSFVQVIDDEAEAEEFGELTAKLTTSFMDGWSND